MFGSLGLPEILFILVLALLVFGPRRLPEVGRTIGKALGEFRRATGDLKRTFDQETSALERDAGLGPSPAAPPSRPAAADSGATPSPSDGGAEAGDEALESAEGEDGARGSGRS